MGRQRYRPEDLTSQDEPPIRATYAEFCRATEGYRLRPVLLDGPFRLFPVHWCPALRVTQPCTIDNGSCAYHDQPRKWYAYCQGWDPDSRRNLVVELSDRACNPWRDFCGEGAAARRGVVVVLWRKPDVATGRVCAKIERFTGDVSALPPSFDLCLTLAAIWSGKRKQGLQIHNPEEESAS